MAEKVEVRGGQNDGAIIQNAASEATLLRVAAAMEKMSGGGAKGAAAGNKANELFDKALTGNIKGLEQSTDRSAVFGDILGKTGKEAKNFGSSLTSAVGSIAGAGMGLVFTGLVAAGKGLLSFFTEGMEGLRETSSVGASFNNDITLLRRTAAEAAMPLEDFTAIVKQNSGLLAQMGGTVTQGAQSFAKMSKEVTTSDFGQNMMMMGMTSGDLNDYLTSYLDIQMRMGRLQGKSQNELIAGAEDYIQEMDKLSKATGLSRKQTEEMLAKQLKEGRLSFMASKLTGDALKNFQAGVILTGSKFAPFQDTLTNAMAGIIKPGDRFGSMMATAVPGFLQFNKALGQGKLSTREQIQGYKDQAKTMKSFLGRFSDEMIAANPELAKMQEYLNSLNEIANANIDDAVKEQDKRNAITKAMGSFGQVFQTVKSDIMLAMIKSGVFERIQKVLTKFAEFFNSNSNKIGPFFDKIISGLDNFLTGIMDSIDTGSITNAFSGLFDSLKPIAMGLIRNLFEAPEQKKKREDLEKKKSELTKKTDTEMPDMGDISELKKVQADLDAMESSSPVEMMLNGIKKSIEDTFPLVTKFFGFFSSDGEKSFSIVETAMNGFKWALDNIGTVLGVGVGVIAGMYLLSTALGAVGTALSAVLIPVAAVVAAFGVAAGGLGYMFENISKIINSFVEGFKSIPVVLGQLAELDPTKLKAIASAMGDISFALGKLAGGGILSSLFGSGGLPDFIKSAKQLELINSDSIKNTVSAVGSINTVGIDLSKQAEGVKVFTDSIKNLTDKIKELQTSLEKLNKTQVNVATATASSSTSSSNPGSSSSSSSSASGAGGGGAAATNPATANAEKLNTLVTELITVTKEVRDFNKDQIDAIRQRGSAMGGK